MFFFLIPLENQLTAAQTGQIKIDFFLLSLNIILRIHVYSYNLLLINLDKIEFCA